MAVHSKERAVVWRHPGTGEVRYPARNDVPMPARYAEQGFIRQELPTLRSLQAFESEKGVLSHEAWWDRGTGRSPEDEADRHRDRILSGDLAAVAETTQAERRRKEQGVG